MELSERKLDYPAPARCYVLTCNEKYSSHAYTLRDVAMTISAGGWFKKGRHSFADADAKFLALGE